MKIYIQSKTGDYNTVIDNIDFSSLTSALKHLRATGGYTAKDRRTEWCVPFEQIEAIREAQPNEHD